jgi:hypothetical protein
MNRVRDRVDKFMESFAIFCRASGNGREQRRTGQWGHIQIFGPAAPRGLTGLLNSSELVYRALPNRLRQTE